METILVSIRLEQKKRLGDLLNKFKEGKTLVAEGVTTIPVVSWNLAGRQSSRLSEGHYRRLCCL
jgi:hypothetical protein